MPFSHASAENITALTEQNVREFIKLNEQYASSDSGNTIEDTYTFIQKHTHDDARFKTSTTMSLAGQKKTNEISSDKDDYLEGILKAKEVISDYKSKIDIQDLKISADKTKATLKVHMKNLSHLAKNKLFDSETLYTLGVSDCTQILRLDQGIIKLYHSSCTTEAGYGGEHLKEKFEEE